MLGLEKLMDFKDAQTGFFFGECVFVRLEKILLGDTFTEVPPTPPISMRMDTTIFMNHFNQFLT
jgi:hypothetical protein